MLKLNQILFVLLVLSGANFLCSDKLNCHEKNQLYSLRTKRSIKKPELERAVIVTKDIKSGTIITKDCVVERFFPKSKIDGDVFEFSKYAIGRRANRELLKGKLIESNDIYYTEGELRSFVFTLKEIPANARIQRDDVIVMTVEYFRAVKPQNPEQPTSCEAVLGKKARVKLEKEHLILNTDLY
ncbi:MAG: hypothetical protein IPG59_11245 [Candidatus Melainabacteria bacterium]|nr:MAG: hypothetical protein IPG59_11245 [Candidatus Melainabacteria bacterium]